MRAEDRVRIKIREEKSKSALWNSSESCRRITDHFISDRAVKQVHLRIKTRDTVKRRAVKTLPPSFSMPTQLIDDIIGWDIASWSEFLPFCEKFLDSDPIGKQALEVGARGGGLSLYLALKGYEVVCSDPRSREFQLWSSMLATV